MRFPVIPTVSLLLGPARSGIVRLISAVVVLAAEFRSVAAGESAHPPSDPRSTGPRQGHQLDLAPVRGLRRAARSPQGATWPGCSAIREKAPQAPTAEAKRQETGTNPWPSSAFNTEFSPRQARSDQ